MVHQPKEPRLPRIIENELDGAEWHWEMGTKHWKLIVNGQLTGIWPKSTSKQSPYSVLNTRSQIRQALRKAS